MESLDDLFVITLMKIKHNSNLPFLTDTYVLFVGGAQGIRTSISSRCNF